MTVHEPNLGNRVRVCNRADKAALDAIAAELGDNLIPFVHDVCDEAGWAKLLDMVRDKSGRLDILFNNAGIMMEPAGLLQISYADWQRQMRINTDSVFLGMKAAAPIMIETAAANGTVGSIVNTSSVYGLAGGEGFVHYCASKGAVRNMTKAAALELGPLSVRVNSLHPGPTKTNLGAAWDLRDADGNPLGEEAVEAAWTPFIAAGRLGEAPEMANMVAFLASDASVYVNGAEMVVDGGYMAR